MSSPERPLRFQFRFSTAIVMMLVASGLAAANSVWRWDDDLKGYGCPFVAIWETAVVTGHNADGDPLYGPGTLKFDYLMISLNLVFALIALMDVWFLCEYFTAWLAKSEKA